MNIIFILITFSLLKLCYQWETSCDMKGRCSISSDGGKPYIIETGKVPKISTKGNLTKKWNKTEITIEISGQIDGVSPYEPLPGKKGYECSGGISECINSCCLDGFCVAILYYCHNQRDTINLIYILSCSFFVFLLCLYWGTYFVLGCDFNKKHRNENIDEQDYGKVVETTEENTKSIINKDYLKNNYEVIDEVIFDEKKEITKAVSDDNIQKYKGLNATNDNDDNTKINNTNSSNVEEDDFLQQRMNNKAKSELPKQFIDKYNI